ncbi:hypothetical protein BGM19_26750 [Streptomyces agglomeratus]|uniref:hypothetical protein n=1 Tax=Streptomyces agglomeratus TaxID=285458 RepID=UPI000868DE69|nr:hypothetical protein [Streptomyces agglomeratus]OEJ61076.1 hypothetical protein BGM19_26750 [Streptomyces agglomeratus]
MAPVRETTHNNLNADRVASATKISAYFYGEELVCRRCVRDIVVPFYRIADVGRSTENILNEVAATHGIDRQDESSFNSHEFPKTVYASEIITGDDACFVCGLKF